MPSSLEVSSTSFIMASSRSRSLAGSRTAPILFLKGAQALVSIAARLCLTEAALELDDLLVARIRLYGDRTALLRRLTELTRVASRWRRQLVRCEE